VRYPEFEETALTNRLGLDPAALLPGREEAESNIGLLRTHEQTLHQSTDRLERRPARDPHAHPLGISPAPTP